MDETNENKKERKKCVCVRKLTSITIVHSRIFESQGCKRKTYNTKNTKLRWNSKPNVPHQMTKGKAQTHLTNW